MKKIILSGVLATSITGAFASGFGLYEASATAYAMGGAVVGRACDASANFYNPATLTDLTNGTVTIGAMTEHPRGRMKVTRNGITYPSTPMNSGCYVLPHCHLAVPLPWDLAFGLGVMPEYGLGSVYDDTWLLNYAGIDTQVESFTVNPNLAWKLNDRFSLGAGVRFIYWDFEQYSKPYNGLNMRLKGDNRMEDCGYQVGVKYDLLDNLALGLVYKSDVGCHVKGKREIDGFMTSCCNAAATIHMPQSVTGGFNWDVAEDWHLGGTVAWTQWSAVDQVPFLFNNETSSSLCVFNWKDTWRCGLAPSWDFVEDWTWRMSYVYETDCSEDQYSTMLPPSERHMISTGFSWQCSERLELSLTYGVILMDGKESKVSVNTGDSYRAYRGISHAAGFTATYRF